MCSITTHSSCGSSYFLRLCKDNDFASRPAIRSMIFGGRGGQFRPHRYQVFSQEMCHITFMQACELGVSVSESAYAKSNNHNNFVPETCCVRIFKNTPKVNEKPHMKIQGSKKAYFKFMLGTILKM